MVRWTVYDFLTAEELDRIRTIGTTEEGLYSRPIDFHIT